MPDKVFDIEKLKTFSDKTFLIHRTAENVEKIYSYSEIINECQIMLKIFKKMEVRKTRISIQCPHSPQLCVIILSILNAECSFCAILHQASEVESINTAIKYGSPFFISLICLSENNVQSQLIERLTIFNTDAYIYKVVIDEKEPQMVKLQNECYSIKTSGSTGNPKIVRVPYSCIAPNINGLSDLLGITSKDLIFISSPITFDPFVVEYFLALKNGASLLITTDIIRMTPNKLSEVLQPKNKRRATILQMTPSLFRIFGLNNIQNTILGGHTSLRILLLGGERFPSIREISLWTAKNQNRTKVFNIYGITEVSCWSTLYEVKPPLTEQFASIGLPIDSETQIRLVNDVSEPVYEGFGDIQVGSANRKCIIDDENQFDFLPTEVVFRSTGDIGYISEGTIYYEGRKTEIIKRYGHRVHMEKIVRTILEIDGVLNSCCVFDDVNMLFICFLIVNESKTKKEIRREVLGKLQKFEKPDDIEFLEQFPVTSHGKISKKDLLLLYEGSTKNSPTKIFERFIANVLCLEFSSYRSIGIDKQKKRKISMDLSFLDGGGTSFQALTLSTQIERALQRSEPKLLEMMVNGATSISTILEYIRAIHLNPLKEPISSVCSNSSVVNELLKVKWQYDTGKCVDATPRCYGNVVCVGSHSHLLITLDSKSGREVSRCVLPDRIECQVSFINDRLLLVGCYDGNLYSIDYMCGKIAWNYDCKGMIKSTPLINGKLAVIGNYSRNGNLICLHLEKKNPLWRIQIGSKGIFASTLKINKNSFLACTLSGETACVLFNNGNITWKAQFQSPIFSTPAILTENEVLVAEVSGVLHCLNATYGTEIWNLKTEGNIFSTIVVHSKADHNFIIFGSHDHNVYCLKSTQLSKNPNICWKSPLNAAVYSTPAVLYVSGDTLAVVSCSTAGRVYILDFVSGSILSTLNLDNEIFSSPCVMDSEIYIGCRNNSLVCLELQCEQITKKGSQVIN